MICFLRRFLAYSLLFCFPLFAAGPVTHARLADLYLHTASYSKSEEEAFRLGTLYPDIRYICSISREETHEKGVTLQMIRGTGDPFIAGMRFHAWVDEKRESFVFESGIYGKLGAMPFRCGYLKFLEDQLLLNHYDWKEWLAVLATYQPYEKRHCSPKILVKWHAILATTFMVKPETLIGVHNRFGKRFLHLNKEELKIWNDRIHEDVRSTPIHKHVTLMIHHFSSLLAVGGSP